MTWVYRRAQQPFESNIRNVNAERFFYGTDTDRELDDEITKLEADEFALLWRSLVEMGPGPIEDAAPLARLVAHFESRTKHSRILLAAPVATVFDAIAKRCQDKEALTNRLIAWIRANPLNFIGDAEIARFGSSAFAVAAIKSLSRKQLEPLARRVAESTTAQIQQYRSTMASESASRSMVLVTLPDCLEAIGQRRRGR